MMMFKGWDINPDKLKNGLEELGYCSFYWADGRGNVGMVIVQELSKNRVMVIKSWNLLSVIAKCINSGDSPEESSGLIKSLIDDEQAWSKFIIQLLPNHFFNFMDTNTRVHKKYLSSAVLKDYLGGRYVDAYKHGHFTRMINDYAKFKGYSVVWSKGYVWFTLNKHIQLNLNI